MKYLAARRGPRAAASRRPTARSKRPRSFPSAPRPPSRACCPRRFAGSAPRSSSRTPITWPSAGGRVVRELGGLHGMMGWDGPILTDSGGFQVFSLADLRKLTDDGVTFRNHIDGAEMILTPESAMAVRATWGRHHHGPGRLPAVPVPARGGGGGRPPDARLGRAVPGRPSPRGPGAVVHRPGGHEQDLRRSVPRGSWRWISRATPSAASASGKDTSTCARSSAGPRRSCRRTGRGT